MARIALVAYMVVARMVIARMLIDHCGSPQVESKPRGINQEDHEDHETRKAITSTLAAGFPENPTWPGRWISSSGAIRCLRQP